MLTTLAYSAESLHFSAFIKYVAGRTMLGWLCCPLAAVVSKFGTHKWAVILYTREMYNLFLVVMLFDENVQIESGNYADNQIECDYQHTN